MLEAKEGEFNARVSTDPNEGIYSIIYFPNETKIVLIKDGKDQEVAGFENLSDASNLVLCMPFEREPFVVHQKDAQNVELYRLKYDTNEHKFVAKKVSSAALKSKL